MPVENVLGVKAEVVTNQSGPPGFPPFVLENESGVQCSSLDMPISFHLRCDLHQITYCPSEPLVTASNFAFLYCKMKGKKKY